MDDQNKNITTAMFYKVLATILLAIVAFFGVSIYNNMMAIQKELIDIKMQLTKIETSHYMTKLEVIEILEKYTSLFPKKY